MKPKLLILLALLGTPLAFADDKHDHSKESKEEHAGHDHDHDHGKKAAGPNGGRVITAVEPHFEFFVTPERKVKITFLGEDNKPVPAQEQTVTAVGGERSKPTRLAFAKEGDALLSDKPLPEGKMVPIILQVKTAPDAKTVTERFTVNLNDCPTCEHKEYACTCEHGHEGHDHGHEGHDH